MLRELCVQGQAGARPLDPRLHASRAVLNSVLTLVFGVRAGSADHPLVGRWLRLSQEFMCVFASALSGVRADGVLGCAGTARARCRTGSTSCLPCATSRGGR